MVVVLLVIICHVYKFSSSVSEDDALRDTDRRINSSGGGEGGTAIFALVLICHRHRCEASHALKALVLLTYCTLFISNVGMVVLYRVS